MRIQIELQKFKKKFGVEHGQGEMQGASEFCLPAERQRSFAPPDSPLRQAQGRLRRLSPHRSIWFGRPIAFAGDAGIFKFLDRCQ